MDMICKCGGKEFFTEKHGNQTGLYCSACGNGRNGSRKTRYDFSITMSRTAG